ncbi:MAG: ATP-binding protein [Candidatus Eremiobacteraeota bacterium]|nr:ATP-binding protein [Candidatus Eremiobacteraeota bacterium]
MSSHDRSLKSREVVQSKRLLFLIAVVLLITAVALFFIIMRLSRSGSKMHSSVVSLEADNAERKINAFFRPLLSCLAITRMWGEGGGLPLNDEKALTARFIPILIQYPEINALIVDDSDGKGYGLFRASEKWVSGLRVNKDASTEWVYRDSTSKVIGSGKNAPGNGGDLAAMMNIESAHAVDYYDGAYHWMAPCVVPVSSLPGITCLSGWKKGEKGGIAAFNVAISQIATLFSPLDSAVGKKVFILASRGEIIDLLPDWAATQSSGDDLKRILSLRGKADPVITATVADWKARAMPLSVPLKLTLEGKTWWYDIRKVSYGRDDHWVAVVLPEGPLFTEMKSSTLLLIFISITVCLVGGGSVIVLVRRYRAILAHLDKERESLPAGEEEYLSLIKKGESSSLEFKSSLRWDVKNACKEAKLEEVILKSIGAFNNSEGGILLIGVNDEGGILGIEADYGTLKEPGKDFFELHLRNLINTEYGIEYATKCLAIGFPMIQGREICAILIKRGERPLFTRISDKGGQKVEKFFVRSGNASREIAPLSELTRYLAGRFPISQNGGEKQ